MFEGNLREERQLQVRSPQTTTSNHQQAIAKPAGACFLGVKQFSFPVSHRFPLKLGEPLSRTRSAQRLGRNRKGFPHGMNSNSVQIRDQPSDCSGRAKNVDRSSLHVRSAEDWRQRRDAWYDWLGAVKAQPCLAVHSCCDAQHLQKTSAWESK